MRAAFGNGDAANIGRVDGAGSQAFILQEIAGHHALHRDQGAL